MLGHTLNHSSCKRLLTARNEYYTNVTLELSSKDFKIFERCLVPNIFRPAVASHFSQSLTDKNQEPLVSLLQLCHSFFNRRSSDLAREGHLLNLLQSGEKRTGRRRERDVRVYEYRVRKVIVTVYELRL